MITDKNKNFRSAFSLIEIAMVILIIGIIIGGATQGGHLVEQAKITSARARTAKSPVASIPNLIMWFETTLLESFTEAKDTNDNTITDSQEIEDGFQITEWKNLSPLSLNGKAVAKAVNSKELCNGKGPIYREKRLNGLPTLEFSSTGGDDSEGNCLYVDKNNPQLGVSDNFTIFVVSRMEADTDTGEEIILNINQDDGTTIGTTARYKKASSDNTIKFYWNQASCSSDCIQTNAITGDVTTFGIYTFKYNSAVSGDIASIYYGNTELADGATDVTLRKDQNGIAPFNTIIGTSINESGTINLDGAVSLDGEIAEIIVYDRKLKDKEIEKVQNYLSDKWKIKF